MIGHATAITPVLPVRLTGPAYFVSPGGEAFPSLIVVLQGYGVTVELEAATFISKAGITSSTFKQIPDVPFSSFDLNLPEGPYSALAANLPANAKGSFCGQQLVMPTHLIAHNGLQINRNTPITPTGCPRAKKKPKPKTARKATQPRPRAPRAQARAGRCRPRGRPVAHRWRSLARLPWACERSESPGWGGA